MKKLLLVSIPAVILLVVVAGGLFWTAFHARVMWGVSVANVPVGGLEKGMAAGLVEKKLTGITEIPVKWGNTSWTVSLEDTGAKYDLNRTMEAVMAVGRKGGFTQNIREIYTAWKHSRTVNAAFEIDEDKLAQALTKIETQINVPASEPEVTIDAASGQINVSSGENGLALDKQQLNNKIKQRLGEVSGEPIEVNIIYLRPKLTDGQMEAVRNRAAKLLGKKISVTFEDGKQSWDINDAQIVAWLDPQNMGWKKNEIENWVAELANTVDRPAQNAVFRFVGGGRAEEFKPATEGFKIKQGETAEEIAGALKKLEAGSPTETVSLAMAKTEPTIKTGDVNTLGIKELIGKGESWFAGSIDNRIFNLAKAAAAIDGTLVPPGEEFSFNNVIGDVSAATGYKQAYIIKEGKTVLGDGGGVCQVSTTLFRAVLAAGLPIEERTAHAYRVSYYEVNYQPGFDATVFQPAPDFKFKNDTAAYLLIQTQYDEKKQHLEFDLYGTGDGRKVEISKARLWDVAAPPPDLYVDDPSMPVGKIVQTEHKAWGAKVAFDWKVTRGGEVLQQRTFYSNFLPWQAVFLKGTKV